MDWRRLALYLLLLGITGVAVELVLLGHYEELWQWAPLILLVVGIGVSVWTLRSPSPASMRALRWLSVAYVLSAIVGVYLHMVSNVEFERELRPGSGGMELIWESLTGAMPALAPGTMMHLGLLGLLIAYRHPTLKPAAHVA